MRLKVPRLKPGVINEDWSMGLGLRLMTPRLKAGDVKKECFNPRLKLILISLQSNEGIYSNSGDC